MEFTINNSKWTIKKVSEAEINNEMKDDYTLGFTNYRKQEIVISENQINTIRTLKHELMHVWLYEYGHNQNDDNKFGYEDVCEIVASSNDFINEIVEKFNKKVD